MKVLFIGGTGIISSASTQLAVDRGVELYLLNRGESARPVITEELTKLGAIVDEAIAYRTVPEKEDNLEALARLKDEGADMITFTSSSTVECFLELGVPLPEHIKIASIGPVTSATIKQRGLKVDVSAKEHTIPGLVAAIEKFYS